MTNININIVTMIINRHINDLKDEIDNDCNVYNDHIEKEIHDDKIQYAIDELRDVLNDIAWDLGEDY